MKLSNLRPCDNCGGAFKGGIFNVVRTSLAFVSPKAVLAEKVNDRLNKEVGDASL